MTATNPTATAGPKRRRRSSEDARRALLDSAARAFARNSYSGAALKDIARDAGTSETAIYNHFGSKAGLFEAAVLEPFQDFLEEYTRDFRTTMAGGRDDEQLLRDCVRDLYDHLHARRDSVLALISAGSEPEARGAVRKATAQLQAMFDELTAMTGEVWEEGGGFDRKLAPLWHRLIHGMIVSITVLEPLYLPDGWDKPSREEVLQTAGDLLLYGTVGLRPDLPR